MNLREQIRQRANRLRSVPLESVLRLHGVQPDRHDKRKWHTSRGILSVNGAKFINWNCGTGGGGAIDLVIHLEGDCSFRDALDWLQRHFPQHLSLEENEPCPLRPALRLPPPHPAHLWHVRSYLVTQRALTPALIDPLIASGTLYADAKANAVFLLQGIGGISIGNGAVPVGAELRGTGSLQWRGMAQGSRKDHGYFSIPADLATAEDNRCHIILCESAIDAISCFALHPGHRCISTSGARPNPAWLASLIDQNPSRPIYCGFDADDIGDAMARAMSAFHPQVQRLRPARHDWNAMLTSRA